MTNPDEAKVKRASFEITLLADVQPVPTTSEVLPGMRPIEPVDDFLDDALGDQAA